MKVINVLYIAILSLIAFTAQATDYTWNPPGPNGSGYWGITNSTWLSNGVSVTWPANGADNNAYITGNSGAITNTSNISIHNLSLVGAISSYTINGKGIYNWNLNGADGNFYVTNNVTILFGGAAANLVFLTGIGNVVKWGTGTLQFQGVQNTFVGNVCVNQGNLQYNGDGSLGSPANQIYLDNGAVLIQNTGQSLTLTNRNIYVGSSGCTINQSHPVVLQGGALQNWTNSPNWTGTPGNVTIQAINAGAGLVIEGTNNFSGQFLVGSGNTPMLSLQANGNSGGAGVTLYQGSTLIVTQTVAGSTMFMNSLSNDPAASSTIIKITFGPNGNLSEPIMYVTNLSPSFAACTINVSGTGFVQGQFPLIKYLANDDGALSDSSFIAGTLPVGFIGYISNNIANSSIDLVLTAQSLVWTAAVNNNWDFSSLNWTNLATINQVAYVDGSALIFNDSALNSTVNLTAVVTPSSITVTNTVPYIFGNSGGSINGSMALTADGPGTVTVQTINNYTGDTIINGGIYIQGTSGAIPVSSIVRVDGGTLDLNGFNATIGGLSGGGIITNSGTGGTNILSVNTSSGLFSIFSGIINDNPSGGKVALQVNGQGGSLILSTQQAYSGSTYAILGALDLGTNNAVPTNSLLYIGGGVHNVSFDFEGFNQTLPGIVGVGINGALTENIRNSGGASTLTLDVPDGAQYACDKPIAAPSPTFNPISIVKQGKGLQQFDVGGTDPGAITVNSGTLLFNNAAGMTGQATVNTDGTFGGIGHFGGAVLVNSGGVLNPGAQIEDDALGESATSIGLFTVNNSVTNNGSILMAISGGLSTTNSQLDVVGTLALGGSLIVTNIGSALTAGETFQLFQAGAFDGAFTGVTLPTLPAGLSWNISLLNSQGVISVASGSSAAPAIGNVQFIGGKFVFSVTGGMANDTFYVLASTNLTIPFANWAPIATNLYDQNGNFTFTNAIEGTQQYFILSTQP